MQSGAGQEALSGEQADHIATQYAKTLNIKNNRDSYLNFTPVELLAAQPKITPKILQLKTKTPVDPTGEVAIFFPVIDGDIIPDMPLTTVRNKQAAAYGLLLGYNTDKMNLFLIPIGVLKKINLPLVLNIAARKVHSTPEHCLEKNIPKRIWVKYFRPSSLLTRYRYLVRRFANALAA